MEIAPLPTPSAADEPFLCVSSQKWLYFFFFFFFFPVVIVTTLQSPILYIMQ